MELTVGQRVLHVQSGTRGTIEHINKQEPAVYTDWDRPIPVEINGDLTHNRTSLLYCCSDDLEWDATAMEWRL